MPYPPTNPAPWPSTNPTPKIPSKTTPGKIPPKTTPAPWPNPYVNLGTGPTTNKKGLGNPATPQTAPDYFPNIVPDYYKYLDPNYGKTPALDLSGIDNLGQTSRAYANTQGAQANMLPTSEYQRLADAKKASQGIGGTSPVGMPTSAEPAIDPLQALRIDLDAQYAKLNDMLRGNYQNIGDQYSQGSQSIRDQYGRTSADMYGDYMNSRKDLEASVQGLGGGNLGQYDSALRQLQETSDLSMNADLSYMDKMKLAQNSALQNMLVQLQQDKEQQKVTQQGQLLEYMAQLEAAKAASSGGGSGRSGGGNGSSGSGSYKETATETSTVNDPQVLALLQEAYGIDPSVGALFSEYYDSSMGNPLVKALTGQIGKASQNIVPGTENAKKFAPTGNAVIDKLFALPNSVVDRANSQNTKVNDYVNKLNAARQVAYGLGGRGNPDLTQKTTTTGSKTTKVP